MSAEPFDPGTCDVNGCVEAATECYVGEAGDVWYCPEHAEEWEVLA